ncbi:MAG: fused MFS/spermidine synthase [Pseudomonadota bacterium]
MGATSFTPSPVGTLSAIAAGRAGLIVFAGTLLVSASLLFSVQPVFAKMVLPHLGGSPSVWAVAMCFFQATLLAGYCYAHALNRFAPWPYAPLIHLVVCVIAVSALPFGLPVWADEPPTGNFYMWLVAVMTVGVGLPFFAVSANAPLLQAWFTRSGHPHADDPYFLYGASNLGSLASLLAYPFLIEPMIGLEMQRTIWAGGFIALLPMLGVCGVLMLAGLRARVVDVSVSEQATELSAAPTWIMRAAWVGLAFVPSALMVAFTTHVTTDIASAPFLWVIPLATFLGTFVIVFRDKSMIPHDIVLQLQPALAIISLIFLVLPTSTSAMMGGFIGFATFVVTTLVCHRALYEARPSADRLTEFYLFMSLGGVLGGMFTGIIAPQIFNIVLEYPLLILAGLLARPGLVEALWDKASREQALMVAGGLGVSGAAIWIAALGGEMQPIPAAACVMFFLLVAGGLIVWPSAGPARSVGAVLASFVLVSAGTNLVTDGINERSFFGVSRVLVSRDGQYRLFYHGSTMHGGEKVADADGNRIENPDPIAYYHPKAPMALGFDIAREALKSSDDKLRVGIIGLGTGSLTCYVQPGESMTLYEIDPVVDKIARDPAHFSYMSRCAADTKTIIGDARITLAKSPDAAFNYLVVDAFSSDSIPVHLMTKEALQLFLSKIPEDGLIAFHISNRYLELESVVAATAAAVPGVFVAPVFDAEGLPGLDGNPSHVVFMAKDKAVIDRVQKLEGVRPADAGKTVAWTDDFADILGAIWRKWMR